MARPYDVIVIGLGGMGSGAACHLARRGRRVLGLERFHPVHALGASHGGSRIYRQSYAEGSSYIPLLLRSRELWDALAADCGQDVFTTTGGLVLGAHDSTMVVGSVHSARDWGLGTGPRDARQRRDPSPVSHLHPR